MSHNASALAAPLTSTNPAASSSATTQPASDATPLEAPPGLAARAILAVFVAVPLAALVAALPLAIWQHWVTPLDLVMLAVLYYVGVHGITIGYHRLFTHGAFRTGRVMRAVLAVAGSVAVEGRVLDWVADHRRHHQCSDRPGDPHSPWEFGTGARNLARGLLHAHVGWLFTYAGSDTRKYAPDLVDDRAIERISRLWPIIAVTTFAVPVVIGWAGNGWKGALTAFFWAGLVRVALVHHMTWSINSVTHVLGRRPFRSRDRSGNIGWAAVLACGENYHNYHHADPSSARHGVLRGQFDSSALLIGLMERLRLVDQVRWPSAERIRRLRVDAA